MPATKRRVRASFRLDPTVVARLAQERGWKGADEIAAGLGIDRATYFRLLKGHNPYLDIARRMADRADVPVEVLLPAYQQAA